MQSGRVKHGAQRLYYEIQGEGHPLLIIPGLAGDIIGYAGQIEAWKEHFQVVAYDNRDVGRSSLATRPYALKEMAEDAAAVIDELGLVQPHVLGISMGSMIAQELAISHPDKVGKLVLVCTMDQMAGFNMSFVDVWRWIVNNDTKAEILPTYIITMCMTHGFQSNAEAVDGMVALFMSAPYPQPVEAFNRQADALLTHDAASRLDRISAETLVVVGAEDVLTPPWCAKAVTEAIPGAKLQVIDGGGHCLFWEIPDAFNQAVLDFLK